MTLYLDMDGVLADFFGGLESHFKVAHWKQIPKTEESIMGLKGTDFFNTLDMYPNAESLLNFAMDYGNWGICSSPLKGDRDNSAYWKRVWLQRHFCLPDIDKLIFTGQKENYAVNKFDGSPNILVDDKPDNITRWIAKGGIGFRYQANEDNVLELIKNIKKALT